MSIRYIAFCTELEPAWPARFADEFDACDWWISAEWAGIENDDLAAELVKPLRGAEPTRDGPDVVVEFGEAGRLRVHAIEAAELAGIRSRYAGPNDDCERGLVFTIESADPVRGPILGEATQALAIGMAGEAGWVLVPSGKWWDIAGGSWMG